MYIKYETNNLKSIKEGDDDLIMEYVKINGEPISVVSITAVSDIVNWGDKKAYEIRTKLPYDVMKDTFKDDMQWSIVRTHEVPVFGDGGRIIDTKTEEEEEDCSSLSIVDKFTDYCNNEVAAVMREQSDLEQAYELLYGVQPGFAYDVEGQISFDFGDNDVQPEPDAMDEIISEEE